VKAQLLVGLLLLGALAGCFGTSSDTTSRSSTGPTTPTPFDGAAALAFVKGLALQADGSPRYRIPGTAGQLEGAAYLWHQSDLPGWSRSWQNFTGSDYLALDRSVVGTYSPGPGVNRAYCSQSDEDKVPSLRFSNLVAIRQGAQANAPLVLLGAHWDSQMHSDNDSPQNRSLPDPGANDGASGVGVLLQLMRTIDALPPLPVAVGVFFIDGEDGFYDCYPDAGSLWYAQKALVPDAFVLLDMVGDPGAIYPRESYSQQSSPGLQDLVWRHGQATPSGAAHFRNETTSIEDDHLAFIAADVPSLDIIDAGRPTIFPPQWDTTRDTVDRLDAAMLALVGSTLVDSLRDPALPATLPPTT